MKEIKLWGREFRVELILSMQKTKQANKQTINFRENKTWKTSVVLIQSMLSSIWMPYILNFNLMNIHKYILMTSVCQKQGGLVQSGKRNYVFEMSQRLCLKLKKVY